MSSNHEFLICFSSCFITVFRAICVVFDVVHAGKKEIEGKRENGLDLCFGGID